MKTFNEWLFGKPKDPWMHPDQVAYRKEMETRPAGPKTTATEVWGCTQSCPDDCDGNHPKTGPKPPGLPIVKRG